MTLYHLARETFHEAKHIWPEVTGGFLAYNWHHIQHRVFHAVTKLLPKGRK